MPASAADLVLLPAFGADHRMYQPLQAHLPDLRCPPPLPALAGESLGAYAERLIAAGVFEGARFVGGSSLGGMIAQEVAVRIKPEAVVLISTIRHPREFGVLSRRLGQWVTPRIPISAYRGARVLSPFIAPTIGLHRARLATLLNDMLRDLPPAWLHWAATAAFTWPGIEHLPCPAHQIHAAWDRPFPASRSRADEIVPMAEHVLPLTHPALVADFIRRRLGLVDAEPTPTTAASASAAVATGAAA